MFPPVTGSRTGKQYMMVTKIANNTVTMLANHPKGPRRTFLFLANTCSDRLCHRSRATGIAKLHCWRSIPLPTNASNAVDEPSWIQPIIKIINALPARAQTGTWSLLSMWPKSLDPTSALSRANAQVKREATSWHAFNANRATMRRHVTKTVAASRDLVA